MNTLLGILYGVSLIAGSFIFTHYTDYKRLQEVKAIYLIGDNNNG